MREEMSKIPVSEFDIIYISYDEPTCEEFWADLVEKVPWAQRIHGVTGFDSAHKAAAGLSETSRFITVDADNIVFPEFFDQELDMSRVGEQDVISWGGRNKINGLIYGNGGLKCWPKDVVQNMRTHENADSEKNQIEFCWDINYIQMNNCYSEVWPNGSPYQAFRAGFREGVKMSLDQGQRVKPHEFRQKIYHKNLKRLFIWCSVGTDVENGLWSIYGSRLGAEKTTLSDWDIHNIRDFNWFKEFWKQTIAPEFYSETGRKCLKTGFAYDPEKLKDSVFETGEKLRKEAGLSIAELDSNASCFFKEVYENPLRIDPMITEKTVEQITHGIIN